MFRVLCTLIVIVIFTFPATTTAASFARDQTFYLKTKSKRAMGFVCGIKKGKVVVALLQSQTSSLSNYKTYKPKTSAERLALTKAEKECQTLKKRPACNDRRDNDLDGLLDFPLDPGCSTKTGTSEVDSESTPTAFEVFRKPFDGEYSLGSLFDHQYPLEFIHTDDVVISSYNESSTPNLGVDGHQGYDFVMDTGTPIYAAYDGVVEFAGEEDPFICPLLNQTTTGNTVKLKHEVGGEQFYSIYAHFSTIEVSNGQNISKGALLGLSGNTGCSTAPHLHFDIQRITNVNGQSPASIDPYGWNSSTTDPWSVHESGTNSFELWSGEEAPAPYRFVSAAPNPGDGDAAAVAITYVRFAGWLDATNLNNEYVELTLDDRFASGGVYNLNGFTLSNLNGEKFNFPSGFKIKSGHPVRVYTGQGTNSEEELYWGKSTPAWSNNGDCVQLKSPTNFRLYYYFYGSQGCEGIANQRGTLAALDYHPAH